MIEKILNGKPAGAPLNSAPRKRRPAEDGEREREEAPIDTPTSDDWWMLEDADSETLAIDPQEPAMALPGSPEKVLILAARHRHGCNLWHPHDLTDHSKRHIAGVTQERGNMLDLERHDRLRGM